MHLLYYNIELCMIVPHFVLNPPPYMTFSDSLTEVNLSFYCFLHVLLIDNTISL